MKDNSEKHLEKTIQSTSVDFSLLYPPGIFPEYPNVSSEIGSAALHDLGIENITALFSADPEHQKEIQKLFYQQLHDPAVITYRQDVIEDLIHNPRLVERLTSLLPVVDSLAPYAFRSEQETSSLHEVIWRIGELQIITDCIEGLGEIFHNVKDNIHSQGFQILQNEIQKIQKDPTYIGLVKELPDLLSRLRACRSITIGINLDSSLRPIQATLLAVNNEPFTDQSLLNKLFGKQKIQEGIAPLHSVPRRVVEGQVAIPIGSELGWAVEPMMVPLFADLAKVLERTTAPIARQLKQYTDINSRLFIDLRRGLIFYLGAVRLIFSLWKQGLPVCRPQIAPAGDRTCVVKDAYNVNLVWQHIQADDQQGPTAITTNDICLDAEGQILILTGPNQGGKTTYLQGVGIIQFLAQLGCYVPGQQANISPVDQILTHFPIEEKPETETGRFGEEAQRLGKLFEQVTCNSLVLLNETLSSTSFGESLYLAQDIVRVLRMVGARVIYSTHLHELASRIDELNSSVIGDSKIISVVSSPVDPEMQASVDEVKRSYKVETRPPLGQSYAREIAARYGISYQQLVKDLTDRGIIRE